MTSDAPGSPARFLPYAVVGTVALLVVSSLLTVSDMAEWHLLAVYPAFDPYWETYGPGLDLLYRISVPLGLAYIIVLIIALILNAIWLHRAGGATKMLSLNPDRPPANRAWLWFCIPFANFYMPFIALRDIYTFAVERDDGMKRGGPGWLSLHWALWIIGGLGGQIMSRQFDAALLRVGHAREILLFGSIFNLMSIGAGLLFIRYMLRVSAGLAEPIATIPFDAEGPDSLSRPLP